MAKADVRPPCEQDQDSSHGISGPNGYARAAGGTAAAAPLPPTRTRFPRSTNRVRSCPPGTATRSELKGAEAVSMRRVADAGPQPVPALDVARARARARIRPRRQLVACALVAGGAMILGLSGYGVRRWRSCGRYREDASTRATRGAPPHRLVGILQGLEPRIHRRGNGRRVRRGHRIRLTPGDRAIRDRDDLH